MAAQQEWTRLAALPAAARAALVADMLWRRAYPPAYRTAYTTTASRIAAAATEAGERNDGAWLTLRHLAAAAGQAISQLAPEQPTAPPADRRTVAVVTTAVATATATGTPVATATAAASGAVAPGHEPSWQRIADVVVAGARTSATLAGSLTATTEVLIGWRARFGHEIADGVTIDGQPANTWISDLLAAANRASATRVAPARVAPASGVSSRMPGRTAAQLAREDQAAATPSTARAVTKGRTRSVASPASASTTTRHAR